MRLRTTSLWSLKLSNGTVSIVSCTIKRVLYQNDRETDISINSNVFTQTNLKRVFTIYSVDTSLIASKYIGLVIGNGGTMWYNSVAFYKSAIFTVTVMGLRRSSVLMRLFELVISGRYFGFLLLCSFRRPYIL